MIISKSILIKNEEHLIFQDNDLRDKIELGRKQLQLIINNDNSDPKCWKDNIEILIREKCGSLNYDLRSQIAFKLAICHLKQLNIDNNKINENDISLQTYNQFFMYLDNICIYVQMTVKDKKIIKSIDKLYHATLQSTDYLMDVQQKQEIFQDEILNQQIEINKRHEKIFKFHVKHEKNINNLDLMTQNINNQQNDIFKKQNEFDSKQNELFKTINKLDIKQENIYKNQKKN